MSTFVTIRPNFLWFIDCLWRLPAMQQCDHRRSGGLSSVGEALSFALLPLHAMRSIPARPFVLQCEWADLLWRRLQVLWISVFGGTVRCLWSFDCGYGEGDFLLLSFLCIPGLSFSMRGSCILKFTVRSECVIVLRRTSAHGIDISIDAYLHGYNANI